jgi:hypothetical protein
MPLGLILDNYLGYIKKLFGDAASIHYDSDLAALVPRFALTAIP